MGPSIGKYTHRPTTLLLHRIALEVIRSTGAAASRLTCRWLIDQIRQAVRVVDGEYVDEAEIIRPLNVYLLLRGLKSMFSNIALMITC